LRKYLKFILLFLLAIFIFWFFGRDLDWQLVSQSLRRANPWYLLLADIDDRKKAEEALQSSERNLSLMINAIPTVIGVMRAVSLFATLGLASIARAGDVHNRVTNLAYQVFQRATVTPGASRIYRKTIGDIA